MTDLKQNLTQALNAMMAVCEQNDQLQARIKHLEGLQGGQELWCVQIQETGELLAMKSRVAADRRAADLNALGMVGITAEVIVSPWPSDIHFDKAFEILEAWLSAANDALQVKTAEIATVNGLLRARASLQE